jgi:hypothetical protein
LSLCPSMSLITLALSLIPMFSKLERHIRLVALALIA